MLHRYLKRSLTVLAVMACAALCASSVAAAAPSPFVKRSGTTLSLGGAPYQFTGLNVYNANSRGSCWYDMVSDTPTGSTLGDSLTAFGSGKEAIRAWFFQSLATANGARTWAAFDHTLAVARAHRVKVVATLANQWGDCEEAAGYRNEQWYRSGYLRRDPGGTVSYLAWVAQVVARYRNDPTILAWQLVNEAEVKPQRGDGPCSTDAAKTLKAFARNVSGVVKLLDRNHLVSLGTLGGGQCGTQGDEYQDVMSVPTLDLCEFHDYDATNPMPGDQWNGLARRLEQCRVLRKPLFVGEVGIKPSEVGGTLQARADAFDAKLATQFAAGVVGELAWAWNNGVLPLANYDIGPGDPALNVLGAY